MYRQFKSQQAVTDEHSRNVSVEMGSREHINF